MSNLSKVIPLGLVIAFGTSIVPMTVQSEEIPARGPIPFAAYDKDGNNLISEEEFYAVRGERMAKRAAEGRLMRGAANAPAFSQFDTNSDGQLTADELTAGQQAQMQKRRGMGMGQGRGMGRGRNMPVFSDFDLNGDGNIVEKEFYEARNRRIAERVKQGYQMRNLGNAPSFADLDTNGDGQISSEEFTVHQFQHRRQRTQ
jgi:Ca2+-binding EF-hand superfamily protein